MKEFTAGCSKHHNINCTACQTDARLRSYERFIEGIVNALRDDIENDEPISGSDAVDWLCELYRDAKKVLKED